MDYSKHVQLTQNEKEILYKYQPQKLVDDKKYKYFSFNWKKLLILDGAIFLLMMFLYFDQVSEGKNISLMEHFVLALFFVGVISIVALAVDVFRNLGQYMNREYLYIYPVYKHNLIKGSCIITYHDIHQRKIVSVRAKLNDDDRFGAYDNDLYFAIMKIKDNKIKFVKLYRNES